MIAPLTGQALIEALEATQKAYFEAWDAGDPGSMMVEQERLQRLCLENIHEIMRMMRGGLVE